MPYIQSDNWVKGGGWWVRENDDDAPPHMKDAKQPWEEDPRPKANANRQRWLPPKKIEELQQIAEAQRAYDDTIYNTPFESHGFSNHQESPQSDSATET